MLRYGCAMFWLALMVSYVAFNIKYPDSCTMDFRYIVPTVICGAVYLAAFWQMLQDYLTKQTGSKRQQHLDMALGSSYYLRKKRTVKYYVAIVIVWAIPLCCTLYALLSAYMFTNLS